MIRFEKKTLHFFNLTIQMSKLKKMQPLQSEICQNKDGDIVDSRVRTCAGEAQQISSLSP